MPIEVPDTRAFAGPPPRRRRTVAKPAEAAAELTPEVTAEAQLEAVGAAAAVEGSAFRKPVRRRKPAEPAAVEVVAQPPAEPALDGSVVAPEAAAEVAVAVEQAAEPAAQPAAEPAAEERSAFSRPVRRRPKVAPDAGVVALPATAGPAASAPTASARVGSAPSPSAPSPTEPSPSGPSPFELMAAESLAAEFLAAELEVVAVVAPEPVTTPSNSAAVPVRPAGPVPPSSRERDDRSAQAAADRPPEFTDTVVVRLAGTRYAVAMDAVAEVGRPPHVTRVPGVPAWISGVANWRGRILPVLDLRVLLGAPTAELGAGGRIMVLTREGVTLAFLAERVEGVVSLELDRLEPVLVTLARTTAAVLSGQLAHPGGPIAVLDLDMLFGLRSQLPRVRRAG